MTYYSSNTCALWCSVCFSEYHIITQVGDGRRDMSDDIILEFGLRDDIILEFGLCAATVCGVVNF
jgi:hypothetical protein